MRDEIGSVAENPQARRASRCLKSVFLRIELEERITLALPFFPKVIVGHQFPVIGRSCPIPAILGVEILNRGSLIRRAVGEARADSGQLAMEILAKSVHARLERGLLPLQFRGPNLIAPPELQNPQYHQQRAEAGDNSEGAQGLFEFGGHRLNLRRFRCRPRYMRLVIWSSGHRAIESVSDRVI